MQTIGKYHGLLVRSQTSVDESLLKAGANLAMVGRAGVGVDNIDIKFAKQNNIAVFIFP